MQKVERGRAIEEAELFVNSMKGLNSTAPEFIEKTVATIIGNP